MRVDRPVRTGKIIPHTSLSSVSREKALLGFGRGNTTDHIPLGELYGAVVHIYAREIVSINRPLNVILAGAVLFPVRYKNTLIRASSSWEENGFIM
jgi:hypothetical protein